MIADTLRAATGLHDVQAKLVGVVLCAGREETEVAEYFGVSKIIFQPDQTEAHEVNALVFPRRQDFGGFAGVRANGRRANPNAHKSSR